MFAFFENLPMLLISRIIAGIGASNIGVAQAYIADVTTKENRSKGMAIIGISFGLGFTFGHVVILVIVMNCFLNQPLNIA